MLKMLEKTQKEKAPASVGNPFLNKALDELLPEIEEDEDEFEWYDIRDVGWVRIVSAKKSGNVRGFNCILYETLEETWVPKFEFDDEYGEENINKATNPFIRSTL